MRKIFLMIMLLFLPILTACDDNESLPMYEVVFMIDNDTVYSTEYVKPDNKIAKPSEPSLEGYKFIQWELDEVEFDFDMKINENIIIYASWVSVE